MEKRPSAFIPKYLIRIVCFRRNPTFRIQPELFNVILSNFMSDFSTSLSTALPNYTYLLGRVHRKGVRLVRRFYKNELFQLFASHNMFALFLILGKLVLVVRTEQWERANNEHVCSQFGGPWYMYASFSRRK